MLVPCPHSVQRTVFRPPYQAETWQRVTADWNDRLDQDKTLLVFGKLNKLRNKAKEFMEN